MSNRQTMYLIDTNVISEARKRDRANAGVASFFRQIDLNNDPLFISVITLGELRRGIDLILHRGDHRQAALLERWLDDIITGYADYILDFSVIDAQVWGRLGVPHYENAIDKQIAATALTHDLTLVTRNVNDFTISGLRLLNPFT